METCTYPDSDTFRPRLCPEASQDLDRAVEGAPRGGEGHEEAVTLSIDFLSLVGTQRFAHVLVVKRANLGVPRVAKTPNEVG